MVESKVQRFEIWQVDLNPTQGSEINKRRPCVIISPNELSKLSTVIVAPMTTKGFNLPSRIELKFKGKSGLIVLDQMRIVDKSRLIQKLGKVDDLTQYNICNNLQEMFAL